MKKALFAVISMIILGIALSGCPGPKSLQEPSATGSVDGYLKWDKQNSGAKRIAGKSVVVTEEDDPDLTGIQGALVKSSGCLKTTTTGQNGYFVLDQITPGPQQLTITKDEFLEVKWNYTVAPNAKTTIDDDAYLEPANSGTLTVNSTPPEADIYIDNKKMVFKTPYTFSPIKTGTHTVYVTKTGYDTPASRDVVIEDTEVSDMKFLLFESKPVYIKIEIVSASGLGTWLIYTGTTNQFVAKCWFSDGTYEACTSAASWTSSNENAGTIGLHSGLFQAKSAGNTSITVALAGTEVEVQTDIVNVTVIQSVLESITVTPSSNVNVAAGYQQQFTAKCRQTDGTETFCTQYVTWTSTDNSKGTIDTTTGLFTGVTQGTTEVFASWQGKVSNSVPVTVGAPRLEGIVITPPAISVSAGLTTGFIANCSYSNNTTSSCTNNVSWTSNNIAVATIGLTSGLLTGVAEGETTVFASWQSVDSNLAGVTVTAPVLQSISIVPPSATVFAYYTKEFTASCIYSDKSTQDCTGQVYWLSSNTNKGTIDSASGIFTGVSAGTTYVTASLQGKTSTQSTVTVKDTATVVGFAYIAGTPAPISGVRVSITVGDTSLFDFTDAAGYYEIDKVPTGSISIIATKTGFEDFEQSVSNVIAPETSVDLYLTQLLPPATLSGTVTDSVTGDPLEGVSVTLFYADLSLYANVTTDDTGYYEITGITPSPLQYVMEFSLSGYDTKNPSLGSITGDKAYNTSLVPSL